MLPRVALLAEGVDRNKDYLHSDIPNVLSPSSRRAWIEIDRLSQHALHHVVALLAEGVDRNWLSIVPAVLLLMSPSSRRAWIEIVKKKGEASLLSSPSSRRAWIEIDAMGRRM